MIHTERRNVRDIFRENEHNFSFSYTCVRYIGVYILSILLLYFYILWEIFFLTAHDDFYLRFDDLKI